MKLSLSPPPYADAPVVVLISGLGGSGSYWLPQLAVLDQEYQVVCYDQRRPAQSRHAGRRLQYRPDGSGTASGAGSRRD